MSESASGLPPRPSLEQLRKQAKELLRDVRAGASHALKRVTAVRHRGGGPDVRQIGLADAQFVLAREYGFESWAKLVHHIHTMRPPELREFERLADEIATAYTTGDFTAIREINWTYSTSYVWDRDLSRMQERLPTWFATATNRTRDLAVLDARKLVARQSGFDDWDQLVSAMTQPPAGGAPHIATASAGVFYQIDHESRTISTAGPVSERGWDTVFAIMEEMALTGLRAGGQMTDAALAKLARFETITELDLRGSNQVTNAGLRHVARLTRLRTFSLGGWDSPITDEGLRVLGYLTELREFDMVWHQRITDAGIANLARCEHLVSVGLMGTPTGDGSLAVLAGKSNLRELRAGTRVSAAGLAALHDIPAFKTWCGEEPSYSLMKAHAGPTHLLLPQRPFAEKGLEALQGLDGLFGLSLFTMGESGGRALRGGAVKPLMHLANLGWLSCDPTDDSMDIIGRMPGLRMLLCQDTDAGDTGFAALSRSPSVEYIWGRNAQNLTGRGFVALSAMPSLRGLATSLQGVDNDSLSSLPEFPALRELMPVGLADDAFRHVGRCRRLQALWLMYCRETGDLATDHVASLPSLQTYYAGATQITDRSLRVLSTMPTIEDVTLWDCRKVSDAGVAALATLPRLRRVTLEGLPGVSRAGASVFRPEVRVSFLG